MRERVVLSWGEVVLAVQAGTMRRVSALKSGRTDEHPDRPDWDRDINGSLAELAVAKWAGVYWSGTVGRIDLPDVGLLQVRSKKLSGDRLVIRSDDSDEETFISVLVQTPVFYLCGWLLAKDARRPEWLLPDGRALHFVRDEFLRPMSELLDADRRVQAHNHKLTGNVR